MFQNEDAAVNTRKLLYCFPFFGSSALSWLNFPLPALKVNTSSNSVIFSKLACEAETLKINTGARMNIFFCFLLSQIAVGFQDNWS